MQTNKATPTVIVDPNDSWVGSHKQGDMLILMFDKPKNTVTLGATETPNEIGMDEDIIDIELCETNHLELRAEDAGELREWVTRLVTAAGSLDDHARRAADLPDPWDLPDNWVVNEWSHALHEADFRDGGPWGDIPVTWVVNDWMAEAANSIDELIEVVDEIPPTWEADGWSTPKLVDAIVPHYLDRADDNNARIAGGEDALREDLTDRIETRWGREV